LKGLERDNAQKRILVEDMKMKLKVVQENVKTDSTLMVGTRGYPLRHAGQWTALKRNIFNG